eukprot:m.336404 g.336404  ORF g.336404 m.336404 type:complete len:211 (-) comp16078_c2_seq19:267-899(-)
MLKLNIAIVILFLFTDFGHPCRDLKCDNVLVTGDYVAKLSDFGTIRSLLSKSNQDDTQSHEKQPSSSAGARTRWVADTVVDRVLDADELHLTSAVGTPMYMSPEQLAIGNATYGFPSDVFSYGVVLWEIAMQRRPDLIEQECGDTMRRGPLLSQLAQLLSEGKRLLFPSEGSDGFDSIPEWLPDLSMACVGPEATRPSFQDIVSLIERAI